MAKKKPTVRRKIRFYAVESVNPEEGFEPVDLALINGIPSSTKPSCKRYLLHEKGEHRIIGRHFGHGSAECEAYFRLTKTRLKGVPYTEEAGSDGLEVLPLKPNQGIAESCHVVWCSERIIAFEYNHFGPRAHHLERYVHRALPDRPRFLLIPLIRRDLQDQIESMEEISLVRMRYYASQKEAKKKSEPSLDAAINTTRTAFGAHTAEVIFRSRPRAKGGWIDRGIIGQMLSALGLKEGTSEIINKAEVHGKVHGVKKEINAFNLYFHSPQDIELISDKHRQVHSMKAFATIWASYVAQQEELESAAGLLLEERSQKRQAQDKDRNNDD